MRDYASKFQKNADRDKAAGQSFTLADQSFSLQRSLQISTDPRYAELQHYNDGGWKAHFANTMDRAKSSKTDPTTHPSVAGVGATLDGSERAKASGSAGGAPSSRRDLASRNGLDGVPDVTASSSDQPTSLEGRCEWQDSFNLTVKRLMVDFDLSTVPQCRLNHLERFHDWFDENGQKQSRKARAEPHYVTISKNEVVPVGSSRNAMARQPLSGTSLILAGSMRMRKSPRLEVKEIAPPVHPAAPPPPGAAPPTMGGAMSARGRP